MKVRWKEFIVLGSMLVTVLLLTGCYTKSASSYINFEQPVPLPTVVAEEEITQRPILIALATVHTKESPITLCNFHPQL